jgi:preprotein translocase subunit SecB
MAKNLPVYDFIGYKLLNATYSRIKITPVEYFIVKIVNSIYNEKTGLFEIFLEVTIKFIEDDVSSFYFSACFRINDLDWKNQLKDEVLESLFVSVVFPFVREKIHSITDDSRGAFILPTIDLRNVSLSKGAKFSPVYSDSTKKEDNESSH